MYWYNTPIEMIKYLNYLVFPQPDMWKKCLDCIDELLNILFENNNIFIGENIAEDSESLSNTDQVSPSYFRVWLRPNNVFVSVSASSVL